MRCAIISNIRDKIGLCRDYELLRDYLESLGHETAGFQWDDPIEGNEKFDLAVYLEVFPRHLLGLSETRFWVPNPEWATPDILETAQRYASKVLTKTLEGQRICEPLFPGRAFFVGWISRDQYDPAIKRENKFLCVAGNSQIRGAAECRDAWRWKHEGKSIGAELTIVSTALQEKPEIPGVTYLERVSEEELKRLQNSHRFHLYLSGTEGYGHAIHEGMSVNAGILTANAPPMNEILHSFRIPVVGKSRYNLADVYQVSAVNVFEAVRQLHWLGERTLEAEDSRSEFLMGNAAFKENFREHLEQPSAPTVRTPRKDGDPLNIAFIGNFDAEHSTENQILWALEQGLGHRVDKLQENRTNLAQLKSTMQVNDMLFWVKTQGWLQIPEKEMYAFLMDLSQPSIGIHLDKFWGIPDREVQIGVHPFWSCDFVFTADGSRPLHFEQRGVKHFFMPPAVSEVYIHRGTPRPEFVCDVGFVGARAYHDEVYPFRGQLIDFLEETYGNRFKHIEGVRGHLLNDAYASMKIAVGDCIFAGIPNYWSDRMVETPARGGFLLSPFISGLTIPLCTYEPQNLENLKSQIDWWLPKEQARRDRVKEQMAHISREDTWTVRMSEVLAVVQDA